MPIQYRTLGFAAGIVSFCTGAILAVYQVQGWTMQSWLAVSLIAVMLTMAAVAVLVLVNEGRKLAAPLISKWALQPPIYRTDIPNPNQWLLDAASEQSRNVASHVIVVEQSVNLSFLEYDEPYIVITYWITNGSIFPIALGTAVTGRASVLGRELKEPLELSEGGGNRWLSGYQGRLRLRQYVSKETASQFRKYVSEQESTPPGGYHVAPVLQEILRVHAQVPVSASVEGETFSAVASPLSLAASRPEIFAIASNR